MFDLFIIKFTVLLLTIIIACGATIKWDIKGEYVIYGKDVTLTCNGNSCPSEAKKKWFGGPNYILLGFDGHSTDSTKYEMMFNRTRQEFDLIIRGFNVSDANCDYACSCGFLQYKNMLKLNYSNFIYLPVVNYDSSNQIDDAFQIDLLMKVFPLPTCELFYEDNAVPLNLTVMKAPLGIDLELNTVRIQRTIGLKSYKCKGNVSLICQIRSLKHRLLHQNVDFCKFKDVYDEHSAENVSIILISVFGFLIISATIAFIIYKCVKLKCCTIESENPTEKCSVQMIPSSNRADTNLVLNLPSSGEEASLILTAYKENDISKYKHSSIAINNHIKECENG